MQQALAQVLQSTGLQDNNALISGLQNMANMLAAQQQGHQAGQSVGQVMAETVSEAQLAESLKAFVQRYPIDARAYDFLSTSPVPVITQVLQNFRPPREGDTDYSGLLTSFVKRTRNHHQYPGGGGGMHPGAFKAAPMMGQPMMAQPMMGQPMMGQPMMGRPMMGHGAPMGVMPGEAFAGAGGIDIVAEMEAFVQKYPVDERAFQLLSNADPQVQLKVMREFRPRSSGDADYSALMTSFTKKCMEQLGIGGFSMGMAPAPNAYPMRAAAAPMMKGGGRGFGMHPQTMPVKREITAEPPVEVILPEGGVPREYGDARTIPGLAEFMDKYPIDERAYDYFASSSPEVQQKVLNEFRPFKAGESNYSGLFTSFVKKIRTLVLQRGGAPDAYSAQVLAAAAGGAPADGLGGVEGYAGAEGYDGAAEGYAGVAEGYEPAGAGGSGDLGQGVEDAGEGEGSGEYEAAMANLGGAAASAGVGEFAGGAGGADPAKESIDPYVLEDFRARFPMDDRAYEYLGTSPREVQERVVQSFAPARIDDTDFSAAVTAYVRSLRNQHSEMAVSSSLSDEAVQQFFQRYPCDVRAVDFFNISGQDVQAQVLREFRPRSEGEADYSAPLTAFLKRCRIDRERNGAGQWGFGPRVGLQPLHPQLLPGAGGRPPLLRPGPPLMAPAKRARMA